MASLYGKSLKALLSTPINQLPLKLSHSPLTPLISRLKSDLHEHEINWIPKFYLSDEWGCPHDQPLVAIPFYLADQQLSELEGKMTKVPAEDTKEIIMYLRHEAGHALNYAYKLYRDKSWQKIFGNFSRPYTEKYKWIPNHKAFVIHLPDWYAQKHPDEDFAETFAVWLTPTINWKKIYQNTPAMVKLRYIDRLIKTIKNKQPLMPRGKKDAPVEKLTMTLSQWYKRENSS